MWARSGVFTIVAMTPISFPKVFSTAVVVTVLATAAAAQAASVGPTQVLGSGQSAPVTISGTGLHHGDAIPPGQRVVSRTISLQAHERRNVRMACRPGWRLQGLAVRALSDGIGFAVRPGSSSYVNRRTVILRTFVDPAHHGVAEGVLYALCTRRA